MTQPAGRPHPGAVYRKLVRANARTTAFLASSARRGLRQTHEFPEIPTRAVSPGLAMSVWVDEVVMGLLPRMPEVPVAEVPRLAEDVDAALSAYDAHKWAEDPVSFFLDPPAPERAELTHRRLGRVPYSLLSFRSEYEPYRDLPGAGRWLDLQGSDRFSAFVLQHPEPGRPWLVNLHGYSSGNPMDLLAFRLVQHHRRPSAATSSTRCFHSTGDGPAARTARARDSSPTTTCSTCTRSAMPCGTYADAWRGCGSTAHRP
jgi:hypothetical protein